MTKEPKLDRARRILEEWEGLDSEIKIVRDFFDNPKPDSDSVPESESHDEL